MSKTSLYFISELQDIINDNEKMQKVHTANTPKKSKRLGIKTI